MKNQCHSTFCTGPLGQGCGTCADSPPLGSPCPPSGVCAQGDVCDATHPDVRPARAGPGAPCSSGTPLRPGAELPPTRPALPWARARSASPWPTPPVRLQRWRLLLRRRARLQRLHRHLPGDAPRLPRRGLRRRRRPADLLRARDLQPRRVRRPTPPGRPPRGQRPALRRLGSSCLSADGGPPRHLPAPQRFVSCHVSRPSYRAPVPSCVAVSIPARSDCGLLSS